MKTNRLIVNEVVKVKIAYMTFKKVSGSYDGIEFLAYEEPKGSRVVWANTTPAISRALNKHFYF